MARNDGIDRTSARNQCLTEKDIGKIEGHNERENKSYTNRSPPAASSPTPITTARWSSM